MSVIRAAGCILTGLFLLAGCEEGPTDWVGDRVLLDFEDGSRFASRSIRGYLVKYDGDGAIIENDGTIVFVPRERIRTITILSDVSSGDDYSREAGSTEAGSSETGQPREVSPLRAWISRGPGSPEAGSVELIPLESGSDETW